VSPALPSYTTRPNPCPCRPFVTCPDPRACRIYTLEKTVHQAGPSDAESRPLLRNEDPETIFSRALDVELEKILSFYQIKGKEVTDEIEDLLRDVHAFVELGENGYDGAPRASGGPSADQVRQVSGGVRSARSASARSTEDALEDSDSGDEDYDDETAALNRRRRTSWAASSRRRGVPNAMMASTDLSASTELLRSGRRLSMAAYDDFAEIGATFSSGIMIKKRIIGLYVQACELKSYIQLNKTGFRKVLKKFDKIVDKELRPKYMSTVVEPAYPFKPETVHRLDDYISKLEQAYAAIVTQGDQDLAKKDLRSHLREHVVWERNTVWRDLIGIERRAEAASLGQGLLGAQNDGLKTRLQGDDAAEPQTKEISTPVGRLTCPTWLLGRTMLTLIVIIAIFIALIFIPIMELPEQQNCLAMLVFVSLLWATEVREQSQTSAVS
jgi:phosphate transporter